MFGAHVAPLSAEYEAPTRRPAAVAPFVSFQPRKILPAELIAIVGSTWSVYGDEPSVILMFGKNGCDDDGTAPAPTDSCDLDEGLREDAVALGVKPVTMKLMHSAITSKNNANLDVGLLLP
jgi:hypothetical protein